MKIFKTIWRFLFGTKIKKPTVQELYEAQTDHKVLQKATQNWGVKPPESGMIVEVPKEVVKVIQPPTTFLADVKQYDSTPNPNKYWRKFKRGKRISWKKFYKTEIE